ncbi:hypothetical protein CBR_g39897 [Chara braunii]|uniref:C2 domain-containing protein n=1 Tax=Chara braunii TaxID=69332 RepID=A0A388LSM5_CHABU|nr:hypothetical protein CBR_g39897 [Chara braunii]|eukprot:GBG85330.1 hypothetical protein CBR_g39897 [Chara braunii]
MPRRSLDNELDPVWNEGFEIKVQDPRTQSLTVRVLDKEVGTPDELIGEARLQLVGLLDNPGNPEDIWLTLYKNCENPREGKPRGKVHLEVVYRPYGPDGSPIVPPLIAQSVSYHDMNKPTELEQMLGNVSPDEMADASTVSERRMFIRGVLMVKVIKAINLEAADIATSTSDPYVQLWMKNKSESKQRTQVIYKELNPVWDEEFEFLVENPNDDMLMMEVYDHDMFGRRDFLGKLSLTLTRVMYHGQYSGEFQLVGAKQGSLVLEMQWNPVPV